MADKFKLQLTPTKVLVYTEAAVSLYTTAEIIRTINYFRRPKTNEPPFTLPKVLFAGLGLAGNVVYIHGIIRRAKLGTSSPRRLATVGALQTASHLLWSWARRTVAPNQFTRALSSDVPKELVTTGPYAYIRNPFYSSYLMAYAAAATLSGRTVDYVLLSCFYVCYYLTSIGEQRKFERSELKEAYAKFKATRARFFIWEF
ncbi:hypothetical protein QBC47DRAFT_391673 [Echria macrotheca]|uniref:Protein-S-isoprenylcysteine O-methyltransferase n=1 Tax=Echria macrotheca TaxID=438768 RepID=A0AAJ0B4E2_9PEZI|nr:hypothetical protein QBC47DRAFT_391673 [Echria macrotheca]